MGTQASVCVLYVCAYVCVYMLSIPPRVLWPFGSVCVEGMILCKAPGHYEGLLLMEKPEALSCGTDVF